MLKSKNNLIIFKTIIMSNKKEFKEFSLTKEQKAQLIGGANEIVANDCGTITDYVYVDCDGNTKEVGEWNDEGCC